MFESEGIVPKRGTGWNQNREYRHHFTMEHDTLSKAPPADTARPGTEPFGVITVIFPVHIIARAFPALPNR